MQYYRVSCNGHADLRTAISQKQTLKLEMSFEDTNFNLKNSEDLKRLYDISKHKVKLNEYHGCIEKEKDTLNSSALNVYGVTASIDSSLNSKELSCLDDVFLVLPVMQKLVPTTLSPNGWLKVSIFIYANIGNWND